jgi:hypothetical protein
MKMVRGGICKERKGKKKRKLYTIYIYEGKMGGGEGNLIKSVQ